MKNTYGFEALHNSLLEILDVIDNICKKYDIKYFLVFGSAIGAVRHKGFIPWDDDLDVAMIKSEYDRFKKVAEEELKGTKYFYQDITTDNEYYLPSAKIRNSETTFIDELVKDQKMNHGVYVDIFPIEGVPNSKLGRLFQKKAASMIYLTWSADKSASKFQRTLTGICRSGIGKKRLIKLLLHLSRKFSYEKCKEVGIIDQFEYGDTFFEKKYYENTVRVEFENRMIPISEAYDKILTKIYGDYMTPPSDEEKVKFWHKPYKMDLNKSYREYGEYE